jgi:hypothetical protein
MQRQVNILRDPIGWVRSHPEIFFRHSTPDAIEISRLLVRDALILGADEIGVRRKSQWWIVGSRFDWLASAEMPTAELFRRLLPFPAAGQNESRAEVVVAAFAESFAAMSRERPEDAVGDDAARAIAVEALQEQPQWNRCIVFSMPR